MVPAHRLRARRWSVGLVLGWIVASWAVAQTPPEPEEADRAGLDLPSGLEIEWQGTLTQRDDGAAMFTGPVTMTWRETRIQADRMILSDRRHLEAAGNVLIVWGQNRVFGDRMTYDLEEERGVIENAIGYALDEYLILAKRIEKIGDKKLRLSKATVTTCNQPLPYWSFAVSSATVTLENYARMWNVRLRALRAPVIYMPYLVWPVKEDRAAGVLMPEFSTTSERGEVYELPVFLPMGRSADLTLIPRYYTKAGLMGGAEFRFIPNRKGRGVVSGFYINDDSGEEGSRKRYRFDYGQTQEFRNGFRMVADVGLVSDNEYYPDFERDLNRASAPQSLARLEFSRNGPWASLNVRELRREQLSSGLVQSTYPEIEWRGRSRKLGKTPLYLAFESSLASVQQRQDGVDRPANTPGLPPPSLDADYLRADIAPEITLPYSPTAWFDITPRLTYRWTHWTQDSIDIEVGGTDYAVARDEGLTRQLWAYGLEVVGPKLYRVFGKSKDRSRYKHTIETRFSYGFDEEFDLEDQARVLSFDEIDRVGGAGNGASYALVQRLFAKRPQKIPQPPRSGADSIVLPDGTTHDSPEEPAEPQPDGATAPSVPVEIASLELRQSRSFDLDRSADTDGDGELDAFSPYSNLALLGRFNPSTGVSIDLRSNYDILFDEIADASLSGTLRNQISSLRFSVFHKNGLGFFRNTDGDFEPIADSTQVQLAGGLNLLRDRLQLYMQGSYDADPEPGGVHFPEKRWRLLYSTQCCTFQFEHLERRFGSLDARRELYFRVDLRGVGKLLQKTF